MASIARFNPFARPTTARGYQATSFGPVAANAGVAPAATVAPSMTPGLASGAAVSADDELPMSSVLARTTNKTRASGGKRNVAPLLIGAGVLALAAVAAGVIVNMSGKRQPLVASESVDSTTTTMPAPAVVPATPAAPAAVATHSTRAAVATSAPAPVAVHRAAVRTPTRTVTPRAASTPSVTGPIPGPARPPLEVVPTPSAAPPPTVTTPTAIVPPTTTDSIPHTPPIEPPATPAPQTQTTPPQTPADTVPHL